MLNRKRSLMLDICDYNNNVLCNLYDSQSEVNGQATNVFVKTERNGWKELSFSLPCSNYTDEGIEENYRIQYLIADYRIRFISNEEIDWYLISEPRIEHDAKAKKITVTAGHIAQLLKTKNLGLEFSDDEGNNVGTAEELLTTILDGTGWTVGYVEPFYEDDGETIKRRSLIASAKSGAFKLVSDLCEKFEAKPIYHGDTRTIDLCLMNPFAKVSEGEIPAEVINGADVLELYYNNNVHNISRTLNTENIVTRLYAYGAYGDHVTGMCSLQTVEHAEYKFAFDQSYTDQEFMFNIKNQKRFFTASVESGVEIVWSSLDFLSRSYVWDGETAYVCYDEPVTTTFIELEIPNPESVKNRFDYVMDFGYYYDVGLLTNEMLQKLAQFQRNMPELIHASTEASAEFLTHETELSKVAESNTGFLKLDVNEVDALDFQARLHINKTEEHPDGVIYRSDYDESRKHYFSWYCAEKLKANGDPVSGIGSVVYIVHDTDPVTWDKAYIRYIDDEQQTQDYSYRNAKDPDTITLWLAYSKYEPSANDRFYLFSTNSISGRMGVIESEDEAMTVTIQTATKNVTEEHPTYFVWDDDPFPPVQNVADGYGWVYKSFSHTMDFGELYFCYGAAKETVWNRVYVAENKVPIVIGAYFFNIRTATLYHGEQDGWKNIKDTGIYISDIPYYAPDTEAQRLSQAFSKVVFYCFRHDRLYKGLYNEYYYTTPSIMKAGNYAIRSDFGFMWAFSIDREIPAGHVLTLDSKLNNISATDQPEDIFKAEEKPYDAVDFAKDNELGTGMLTEGTIDRQTGQDVSAKDVYRTGNITLYPSVEYQYTLPNDAFGVFYDGNRRFLDAKTLSGSGTFETTPRTKYIRIVSSAKKLTGYTLCVKDKDTKMFIKDLEYKILSPITVTSEREGLMYLIKRFADLADETYSIYLQRHLDAQAVITAADNDLKETLGDVYREGYWQNAEYVEGDESKLYKDALDNLEKISKPEATYDITFLDLYGANTDQGYATSDTNIDWPDIDISNAVHLVDKDININLWAYIDVLNKCYDQPWNTSISINTNLSTIGQHSFTDVLTQFAEVATTTKTKQQLYQRASNIDGAGKIAAENIEGMISANVTQITGGSSSWFTDDKGNMVFESADGNSAMMLSGAGYAIASAKDENGDWEWRNAASGSGVNADEITTGYISAKRIMSGTITVDHINSTFGEQLDIGTNVALTLFATIDGEKPAGGVLTPTVNPGDSYIQIGAKSGADPAYINIMTGGMMNINAGSSMNIKSTGELHIESGSVLTVSSKNLTIDREGNATFSGTLNAAGGTFKGTVSAGHIVGGDINIGNGTFVVTNTGALTATSADIEGTITGSAISGGTINGTDITGGTLDIGNGTFKVTNTGALTASSANITGGKITIGSNFSVDNSGNMKATNAEFTGSIKTGSSITCGTKFSVDSNGIMKATDAEFTGSIKTGSTITCGTKFSVTDQGVVTATDITISGGSITIKDGNTENFKVTNKGILTAKSVDISGKITATSGEIGGWSIGTNQLTHTSGKVGLAAVNSDDSYTIWAGNATASSAAFRVKRSGALYATSAEITGKITATSGYIGTSASGFYISDSYITNPSTKTAYNSSVEGVYIGVEGIGLGANKFTVTKAGKLTATNIDISGKVTATSGYIGSSTNGFVINDSYIANPSTKTSYNNSVEGVYIGTSGIGLGKNMFTVTSAGKATASDITINGGDITIKDGTTENFKVTNKGVVTCKNITAEGGYIGTSANGFAINTSYIANPSTKNTYNSSVDGVYIGTSGIGLGKNKFTVTYQGKATASDITINGGTITIKDGTTENFKVTDKGILTAKGANISGTITATAGSVGGWSISETELYKGNVHLTPDGANPFRISNPSGGSDYFYVSSAGAIGANSIWAAASTFPLCNIETLLNVSNKKMNVYNAKFNQNDMLVEIYTFDSNPASFSFHVFNQTQYNALLALIS